MARPPFKAAADAAREALVQRHQDEYQTLVAEYLTSQGWAQETIKKVQWTRKENTDAVGR